MIRIKCPGCEAGLRITDDLAGTAGECPGCGAAFTVPQLTEIAPTDVTTAAPPAQDQPDTASAPDATFDPMDVLDSPADEPANQPVHTPVTVPPEPSQAAAEPATAEIDSDTASAAAAVAMQRKPVAVPRPQPTTKAGLKEEIADAFSSRERIIETFREQPLLLVLAALMLVGAFMFMPTGCDNNRVPVYAVSGRVMFKDGSPVRTGNIELLSEQFNTTASGRIDEDGSFVLGTYTPTDGAAAGSHKMIVRQTIIADGLFKHVKDHGLPVSTLHSRYETSGLRCEVSADEPNELLVEVDPQPKQQDHSH